MNTKIAMNIVRSVEAGLFRLDDTIVRRAYRFLHDIVSDAGKLDVMPDSYERYMLHREIAVWSMFGQPGYVRVPGFYDLGDDSESPGWLGVSYNGEGSQSRDWLYAATDVPSLTQRVVDAPPSGRWGADYYSDSYGSHWEVLWKAPDGAVYYERDSKRARFAFRLFREDTRGAAKARVQGILVDPAILPRVKWDWGTPVIPEGWEIDISQREWSDEEKETLPAFIAGLPVIQSYDEWNSFVDSIPHWEINFPAVDEGRLAARLTALHDSAEEAWANVMSGAQERQSQSQPAEEQEQEQVEFDPFPDDEDESGLLGVSTLVYLSAQKMFEDDDE